jgi:menaquinone-dependent protoporphyrinogen IX oxidase
MSDTAIIYGTKKGASAKTANVIANILQERYSLTADVFDVKKQKNEIKLENYVNLIIGSSITGGTWTKEIYEFMKNDFSGKKVFMFVSSCGAGGALKTNNEENYQKCIKRFIDDNLADYPHVKLIDKKAFGGILRLLGITFMNNWDEKPIKKWAEELGTLLT